MHPVLLVALNDLTVGSGQSMYSDDVRYLKSHADPLMLTARTSSGQFLIVELNQEFERVEECAAPKQCDRTIHTAGQDVGKTTLILSGGGLTVQRHSLVEGASLTSSYYTSNLKSHVLIVPLTAMDANFNGDQQDLRAGHVYFTEAEQADISAVKGGSRWIAIRVAERATSSESTK
jgi:hypothetical protein